MGIRMPKKSLYADIYNITLFVIRNESPNWEKAQKMNYKKRDKMKNVFIFQLAFSDATLCANILVTPAQPYQFCFVQSNNKTQTTVPYLWCNILHKYTKKINAFAGVK